MFDLQKSDHGYIPIFIYGNCSIVSFKALLMSKNSKMFNPHYYHRNIFFHLQLVNLGGYNLSLMYYLRSSELPVSNIGSRRPYI